MPTRAMVPVLVTVEVWLVVVVKVSDVADKVAAQVPAVTASAPVAVAFSTPAPPAAVGSARTARHRTAASAAVLCAVRVHRWEVTAHRLLVGGDTGALLLGEG